MTVGYSAKSANVSVIIHGGLSFRVQQCGVDPAGFPHREALASRRLAARTAGRCGVTRDHAAIVRDLRAVSDGIKDRIERAEAVIRRTRGELKSSRERLKQARLEVTALKRERRTVALRLERALTQYRNAERRAAERVAPELRRGGE
jgi:hypothetical protein